MPVTPEDIANMALGLLEEAPIDTLDEDSRAGRLVNLHYDLTREAELSKHAWNFAIMREDVTGTDTQVGTLHWSYDVPADALRVLPLTYDGEPGGIEINWRREGSTIYTDQSSPRTIRYIGNLVDPDDWTALFTEVLIAALAMKMAHPLTHKASMYERAKVAYDAAVDAAATANAFERGGTLNRNGWEQARGDTRWRY